MTQKGLFYTPSPPPQTGDVAQRNWNQREFERIADAIREGSVQWLRMDVLTKKPPRPQSGLVVFFAANAVSAGSQEGCYEYSSGSWRRLAV